MPAHNAKAFSGLEKAFAFIEIYLSKQWNIKYATGYLFNARASAIVILYRAAERAGDSCSSNRINDNRENRSSSLV